MVDGLDNPGFDAGTLSSHVEADGGKTRDEVNLLCLSEPSILFFFGHAIFGSENRRFKRHSNLDLNGIFTHTMEVSKEEMRLLFVYIFVMFKEGLEYPFLALAML